MNKSGLYAVLGTLSLVAGLSSNALLAADEKNQTGTIGGLNSKQSNEEVIEPDIQTKPVKVAQIDTEKFELGAFTGMLNVEDFSSSSVTGIAFTYHITPRIIAQVIRGESTVERATFEDLAEGTFLKPEERDFIYTNIYGGYQLLHGRSFWGSRTKWSSSIYAIGGVGKMEFAGNDTTGYSLGLSYRLVPTDWMTINLDFRDHIFDRDVIGTIGDGKTTHNTEFSFGLNALF